MPKPTFFQTILRRPTRSYTDPHAASPWADYPSYSREYYEAPAVPSRYNHAPRQDRSPYSQSEVSISRDGPDEAGPSTRRKSTTRSIVSAVSDSQSHKSMGTKVASAKAKKTTSTVSLRDGMIVRTEASPIEDVVRSGTVKRKKKISASKSEAASTVPTPRPTSPTPSRTPTVRTAKPKATKVEPKPVKSESKLSSTSSQLTTSDISQPPPLQVRGSGSSSSAASSPIPPISPALYTRELTDEITPRQRLPITIVPISFTSVIAPPLTPPHSDLSSVQSSLQDVAVCPIPKRPDASIHQNVSPQPESFPPPRFEIAVLPPTSEITIPPPTPQATIPPPTISSKSAKRLSIVSIASSNDGEDIFYTPRTSIDLSILQVAEPAKPKPKRPGMARNSSPSLGVPLFTVEPPTPDHIPDPVNSPFHSEPSSSSLDLLYPDDSATPRPFDRPQAAHTSTEAPISATTVKPPVDVDLDAQSASGEVGSDDEAPEQLGENSSAAAAAAAARGRRSRRSSFTAPHPPSRNASREPSVILSGGTGSVEGHRPLSRQSTTSRAKSSNSFDDFVVFRKDSTPLSDASFGARSIFEGSIRSGIGGYGKGGWAAAGASRSGAISPVTMYMPTAPNDGWAEFQPPPRRPKFTPLPPTSQPKTFNGIVHGRPNDLGLRPQDEGSAPSKYSQGSEEEDSDDEELPKPSRSYAKKGYPSEYSQSESRSQSSTSRTGTEDRVDVALPRHQAPGSLTIDPPSQSTRFSQNKSLPPQPDSPQYHTSTLHRLMSGSRKGMTSEPSSRPISPRPPSTIYDSRSTSPLPDAWSRPESRVSFDPPSFLNPDTLTVLPEMSLKDSARTYVPSESVRSVPRRSASVFGGFSKHRRTQSEWDDEDDELPELPPRRAKSAMGHRPLDDLSRWEGRSAGDGVLMESHGRGPESVSGYTNLVLPAGAYRPSNPARSASEINSRILGMPHSSMAAIIMTTLPARDTPLHIRRLDPPVDFSSHLKPPTKIGSGQILVQVYAAAVDEVDIKALEDKGRGDVGKWVPGRSFVGRCIGVGAEEKDVIRGDIVIGIMDVRKSGALAEYLLCDRRRVARAPISTVLTLEQLSVLPLHGIAAARAVRTNLARHSRAIVMNAHQGVPALVCQELSRAGVNVTAVIADGDDHHEAQSACMANGAKGVLTGTPEVVMMGLDEDGWEFVLDTQGGQRVYDAAKRVLKDGGKILTLVAPTTSMPSTIPVHSRKSGFKTLRAALTSRRKETKHITFEYLTPTGSGEPEVDSSGVDCRDVMEESCMLFFKPIVAGVIPLEKGVDAFKIQHGVAVVRLVN